MQCQQCAACRRVLESTWATIGLSPITVRQRLREFERVGGAGAQPDDVREFLQRFPNLQTRRNKLSSLRSTYRMLVKLGILEHDPTLVVPKVRANRWTPKPLTEDEVDEVLSRSTGELRDWFVLALYAGLRASEIATLQAEQLERGLYGWQLRIIGKGDREAVIPAHSRVVEVFRTYPPQGRLWPGLTANAVTNRARYWMHQWGITGGVHRLRHNFATRALEASGESLLVVRDLLRHASVSTTQVYTQLGDERLFETMRKIA